MDCFPFLRNVSVQGVEMVQIIIFGCTRIWAQEGLLSLTDEEGTVFSGWVSGVYIFFQI